MHLNRWGILSLTIAVSLASCCLAVVFIYACRLMVYFVSFIYIVVNRHTLAFLKLAFLLFFIISGCDDLRLSSRLLNFFAYAFMSETQLIPGVHFTILFICRVGEPQIEDLLSGLIA